MSLRVFFLVRVVGVRRDCWCLLSFRRLCCSCALRVECASYAAVCVPFVRVNW